ncbi:DeoR/GlpR family DNA-binding transcription regulator [Caproiciproducens sp. CPB-2]|uniref:DeoR/GlpR family DNA-binding transcription regulator n=1 Tax=Caproiciproducens sp. CPB-2 TaxID=3030017 RepID=UPI0023D9A60F|nr:DeoR/GlpR family DNA-binding transcription regulator [Caproiciproducens sp. CPB-2]MDF1493157.1 DeoR/GlpR family DNA-binding transcription regulator [Caproiciproducens sp. CPB-2]
MFEEERRISILNKINIDHRITTDELAEKYSVSQSTIRRDLASLEKSGLLKRTHGGAILAEPLSHEYDYNAKRDINRQQKFSIAKHAASLVKNGSTIALGTSTLTHLMAQELTASGLTIVTNSIDVVNVLVQRPDYNLVILGGNYIHSARTIEGMMAIDQIQQIHFDQAFLGANGIDYNFGLSTTSAIEANSKKAFCQNSKQIFFLCDHPKFGRISSYKIIDMDKASCIITDREVDASLLALYRKKCNITVCD